MKYIFYIAGLILLLPSCGGDTTKTTYTSKAQINPLGQTRVLYTWDTAVCILNSNYSYLQDDQLDIEFLDTSYGVNGVSIRLQRDLTRPLISYVRQYAIPTDCLYVAQKFKVLQQKINLKNDRYKVGDSIFGSIDLMLLGKKDMFREPLVPFMDERKWDTVTLKGVFVGRVN